MDGLDIEGYSGYTQAYPEENVYRFMEACHSAPPTPAPEDNKPASAFRTYAVFASNAADNGGKVAANGRRLGCLGEWRSSVAVGHGPDPLKDVAITGYHVFCIVREETPAEGCGAAQAKWWAVDCDTKLGGVYASAEPVPLARYMQDTFAAARLRREYEPRLRVVPCREFLEHFRSDRCHMLRPAGKAAARERFERQASGFDGGAAGEAPYHLFPEGAYTALPPDRAPILAPSPALDDGVDGRKASPLASPLTPAERCIGGNLEGFIHMDRKRGPRFPAYSDVIALDELGAWMKQQ
jgi:hypothetical protein